MKMCQLSAVMLPSYGTHGYRRRYFCLSIYKTYGNMEKVGSDAWASAVRSH